MFSDDARPLREPLGAKIRTIIRLQPGVKLQQPLILPLGARLDPFLNVERERRRPRWDGHSWCIIYTGLYSRPKSRCGVAGVSGGHSAAALHRPDAFHAPRSSVRISLGA